MKKHYCLGIDPGEHTGLAIWSKTEKCFKGLMTLDFWRTVKFLECFEATMLADSVGSLGLPTESQEISFEVFIEDPAQNSFIYSRHKKMTDQTLQTVAQRIGMNKMQATLLIRWMQSKGIKHTPIKPVSQKWTKTQFDFNTKWQGSSSEHSRDAARFVFQR